MAENYQQLKKTPLYDEHLKLNAKMVPFAGWEMPVSYSSIIEEHLAVRNKAGIFDISHMGTFKLRGKDALALLQRLTTNDAAKLLDCRCQYSVCCNASGGVLDDLLVYKLKDEYMIVANASNVQKVISWFVLNSSENTALIDQRESHGIISLQGPFAEQVLQRAGIKPLPEKKNHCLVSADYVLSRTGYTGEDGFEFFIKKSEINNLWKILLAAGKQFGIRPCGLGARDTLRLEAGLPLYGHEYDESTSPLEAGYRWAVKFDKGEFIGKEPLRFSAIRKKLIGLSLQERSVPRHGFTVFKDENMAAKIGAITSGTFSPSLNKPIAMAYILPSFGDKICFVEIRGKACAAQVEPLPFYTRTPQKSS